MKTETLALIETSAQWNVQHFGTNNRMCQTMEECGELIQACNKVMRFYAGDPSVDNGQVIVDLIEEMADVIICIKQLQHLFSIQNARIEEVMDFKMEREMKRIKFVENMKIQNLEE